MDVLGRRCCTWLSKLVRHQPQECLHRDGSFYVLVSVSFVSRCVCLARRGRSGCLVLMLHVVVETRAASIPGMSIIRK